MSRRSVLVVDVKEVMVTVIGAILRNYGYRVDATNDIDRAARLAEDKRYDLVVTGFLAAGSAEEGLLNHIAGAGASPPLLVVCPDGHAPPSIEKALVASLRQPFTSDALITSVDALAGGPTGISRDSREDMELAKLAPTIPPPTRVQPRDERRAIDRTVDRKID